MEASNGLGFWSGLMRGLAASLEVYEPLKPLEPRSQEQTMRGDWARIGEDFKVVIARVNGRADQR